MFTRLSWDAHRPAYPHLRTEYLSTSRCMQQSNWPWSCGQPTKTSARSVDDQCLRKAAASPGRAEWTSSWKYTSRRMRGFANVDSGILSMAAHKQQETANA